MDNNRDGKIDWVEFEQFMKEEIASGKSLLSGDYVLPSGGRCCSAVYYFIVC